MDSLTKDDVLRMKNEVLDKAFLIFSCDKAGKGFKRILFNPITQSYVFEVKQKGTEGALVRGDLEGDLDSCLKAFNSWGDL